MTAKGVCVEYGSVFAAPGLRERSSRIAATETDTTTIPAMLRSKSLQDSRFHYTVWIPPKRIKTLYPEPYEEWLRATVAHYLDKKHPPKPGAEPYADVGDKPPKKVDPQKASVTELEDALEAIGGEATLPSIFNWHFHTFHRWYLDRFFTGIPGKELDEQDNSFEWLAENDPEEGFLDDIVWMEIPHMDLTHRDPFPFLIPSLDGLPAEVVHLSIWDYCLCDIRNHIAFGLAAEHALRVYRASLSVLPKKVRETIPLRTRFENFALDVFEGAGSLSPDESVRLSDRPDFPEGLDFEDWIRRTKLRHDTATEEGDPPEEPLATQFRREAKRILFDALLAHVSLETTLCVPDLPVSGRDVRDALAPIDGDWLLWDDFKRELDWLVVKHPKLFEYPSGQDTAPKEPQRRKRRKAAAMTDVDKRRLDRIYSGVKDISVTLSGRLNVSPVHCHDMLVKWTADDIPETFRAEYVPKLKSLQADWRNLMKRFPNLSTASGFTRAIHAMQSTRGTWQTGR